MKRIVSIMCALCFVALLVTSVFTSTACTTIRAEEAEEKATGSELVTVVNTKIGSGESDIGYETADESEMLGPEDFIVDASDVIILDSANYAVKIFENGRFCRSIDI